MYYALIGLIIMFLVAYPVSLLTGGTDSLDENLLTPFMRSKAHKKMTEDDIRVIKEYIEVKQISNNVIANEE